MRKTELFRLEPKFTLTRFKRCGYLATVDAVEFLQALKDESADVAFVDPPFNLGKDYGVASSIESVSEIEYESYLHRLLLETVRILKPGGALFLYHLPLWASRLAPRLHETLTFRHWIAVAMKNGYARKGRLYPAHYALLYFTKGAPASFTRPRLAPTRCRHCKKLVKDYGGYREIIEEQGINLSDFWDDLSPVRHSHMKHRHANELPEKLTDRVAEISGFPGAVLVDPFVGTGTSLVSGLRYQMHFIANDLDPASVETCLNRLSKFSERPTPDRAGRTPATKAGKAIGA